MHQIFCTDFFRSDTNLRVVWQNWTDVSEEIPVSAILMKEIQSSFETSLNFDNNTGCHTHEDIKHYIRGLEL